MTGTMPAPQFAVQQVETLILEHPIPPSNGQENPTLGPEYFALSSMKPLLSFTQNLQAQKRLSQEIVKGSSQ